MALILKEDCSGRTAARPDSRVPSTFPPRPCTRLLWPKLRPLAVASRTHLFATLAHGVLPYRYRRSIGGSSRLCDAIEITRFDIWAPLNPARLYKVAKQPVTNGDQLEKRHPIA